MHNLGAVKVLTVSRAPIFEERNESRMAPRYGAMSTEGSPMSQVGRPMQEKRLCNRLGEMLCERRSLT